MKHGATIAIANKFGDTPLTKARPKLRKKLEGVCTVLFVVVYCLLLLLLSCEGLAAEHGQKLVIVQHKSKQL